MKSENLICLQISLLFTLCSAGFGGFDLCDDLGVGAEGHTDRRGRRKFFQVFFLASLHRQEAEMINFADRILASFFAQAEGGRDEMQKEVASFVFLRLGLARWRRSSRKASLSLIWAWKK